MKIISKPKGEIPVSLYDGPDTKYACYGGPRLTVLMSQLMHDNVVFVGPQPILLPHGRKLGMCFFLYSFFNFHGIG